MKNKFAWVAVPLVAVLCAVAYVFFAGDPQGPATSAESELAAYSTQCSHSGGYIAWNTHTGNIRCRDPQIVLPDRRDDLLDRVALALHPTSSFFV